MTKLLAVGGPNSFEWLEDTGNVIKVVLPTQLNAFVLEPDLTNSMEYKTGVYYKSQIGMLDATNATLRKYVYLYEDINWEEADRLLKQWLMEAFMRMDNPE
jgi:hypothetical protein